MMNKQIIVDEKKWELFKKWCINHDTTIKDELDKFITKVLEG